MKVRPPTWTKHLKDNEKIYLGSDDDVEMFFDTSATDMFKLSHGSNYLIMPKLTSIEYKSVYNYNIIVGDAAGNRYVAFINTTPAIFFKCKSNGEITTNHTHSGTNSFTGWVNFGHEIHASSGVDRAFTDGDTTPSVNNCCVFITANTGATTITAFDDGVDGQIVIIIFNDANTTVQHGSGVAGQIYLSGGANKTFSANQSLVIINKLGVWIQIGGEI